MFFSQGVFLRDLTFIEESNHDWIGTKVDGLVNFEKLQMIGNVITDIKRLQSLPYQIHETKTRLYLENIVGLDEDELYKQSLYCEPNKPVQEEKKRDTLMNLLEK